MKDEYLINGWNVMEIPDTRVETEERRLKNWVEEQWITCQDFVYVPVWWRDTFWEMHPQSITMKCSLSANYIAVQTLWSALRQTSMASLLLSLYLPGFYTPGSCRFVYTSITPNAFGFSFKNFLLILILHYYHGICDLFLTKRTFCGTWLFV